MNWYYAVGGQQQGPIDDSQLDALVQSGTVTLDTLVWRDGMANWQPLRHARPSGESGSTTPPMAAPPVAGGVGKPSDDDFYPAQPLPAVATLSEEEVLARDYRIEIGECIERAWKVVTGNLGVVLGAAVLLLIIALIGWALAMLAGTMIPYAHMILPSIYVGPLMGGFMLMMVRLLRREEVTVGDAFSGFTRNGIQLMLASLVQGLVGFVTMLPMFLVLGIGSSSFGQGGMARMTQDVGQIMLGVGLGLVGAVFLTYVSTLWTHAYLLIVDKGYKFWPAMQLSRRMVSKRWWMTFLFLIVAGILSNVGFIACCIGWLVSYPVYFAMRASFYDDNFRDLAPVVDVD